MRQLYPVVFAVGLIVTSATFAGQDEFCEGFTEGFKSVKGDQVVVPVCPVAPVTPVGSTDYREGLKTGIREAERR